MTLKWTSVFRQDIIDTANSSELFSALALKTSTAKIGKIKIKSNELLWEKTDVNKAANPGLSS